VLPFDEDMLLEVTPDGKIAREWWSSDLCARTAGGLLYLGDNIRKVPIISGDILHLNDVELFRPGLMKEGFFKKGDVLVSLRNISTIFVFNRKDEKIKYICTGSFVRQHDPDFIDGDTLSVFDNHADGREDDQSRSRILIISPREQTVKTFLRRHAGASLLHACHGQTAVAPHATR